MQVIIKNKSIVFLFLFTVALQSCEIVSVYESKIDFESESWNEDSIKAFNFEINKKANYNIYYLVKNTTSYPFSNLYLNSDLRSESEKICNKLQEVTLFHPKTGQPYGQGFGGIMEHKFYSLKNQTLKEGRYSLSLKHYMREKHLKGIIAIGVRVDKISE